MTTALVHPDRYKATTNTRKTLIVVHDSEGSDGSYAVLRRLVTLPGDRLVDPKKPNGPKYGSAYHAITRNDAGATFDQVLPATAAPNAGPPVNATAWHICMPGYARQTEAEWLDAASRSGIRAVAKFIVEKCRLDGIPLVRRSVAELKAGLGGYCGHGDVSLAWGKSTHTDPSPTFPWYVLEADIRALAAPAPAVPAPLPLPLPPSMSTEDAMLIIVGRDANRSDPRRWVWNGVSIHFIPDESTFVQFYGDTDLSVFKGKMDPRFKTLAAPFWMDDATLRSFGAQV